MSVKASSIALLGCPLTHSRHTVNIFEGTPARRCRVPAHSVCAHFAVALY